MNLEDITLSEISPMPQDEYCIIPRMQDVLESSNLQRQQVEEWLPGAGGFIV